MSRPVLKMSASSHSGGQISETTSEIAFILQVSKPNTVELKIVLMTAIILLLVCFVFESPIILTSPAFI